MSEVCLIIVFNHKYNKNIPVLEKIYGERFHNRFYIVPFHQNNQNDTNSERIIPVYETSYCFQGYLTQAYEKIKSEKYTHYIVIGDDQILNPKLNEKNIISEMGLGKQDSFIKNIIPYGKSEGDQSNKLYNILSAFNINVGVSYLNEIPSYEDALHKCTEKGFEISYKLPVKFFLHKGYLHPKHILLTLVTLAINKGRKLPYPLYKSYADMIVIDKYSMDEFIRLSGIFAAMNIFVESAIPTAMILACNNIKLEKNLENFHGVEKWREEIPALEKSFDNNLDNLFNHFGDDVLYYHPIKLSRWNWSE